MVGRGGGGGRSSNLTAIANTLGIQRSDISSFNQQLPSGSQNPAPLFPPLVTKPVSLPVADDLQYMAELKQELINRFQESPYYLKAKVNSNDIKRYTDKYRSTEKEAWTPDWNRLPKELKRLESKKRKPSEFKPKIPTKKPRVEEADAKMIAQRLTELEKLETQKPAEKEEVEKTNEEENEEENQTNVEAEDLSDDDYLEEQNDYIDTYFDNGDDYLDETEDNPDDDAIY